MTLIMRELKINAEVHLAIPALRNPSNLSMEFVTLQLFHNEMMQNTGLLLVFMHGVLSHFCLFCNFTVLRHWEWIQKSTKV